MARINIEDQLFRTQKFMRLVAALGDPDRALGRITRAYMVAQRYWFPSRSKIPETVWTNEELGSELITIGIAERDQDGIYVHGTREQFEWLFQKQKAGQESAKARARQIQHPSTPVEQPSTSSLSSLSSSFNSHSSKTHADARQERPFDPNEVENPAVRAFMGRVMAGKGLPKTEKLLTSNDITQIESVKINSFQVVDNTKENIVSIENGELLSDFSTSDNK